jgi:putative copper export protein
MMWEIHWLVSSIHLIAAAVWVGGSCMYLFVVLPALRLTNASPALAAKVAELFKRMVNICIGCLLLSGVYLIFDRLTQTTLGLPYIIVLVIKIIAALALFALAAYMGQSKIRRLAKRSTRFSRMAPQVMLALGILVCILGVLLNTLFELTVTPH